MNSNTDASPSAQRETPRPRQPLTARALLEVKRLSDPQIHPDRQRVAFVASEANFDESHWISHLWLTEYLPAEESEEEEKKKRKEEEKPEEEHPNTQSPTPDADDPTRQLTFSADGEIQPRWSPDGRYLAFLSSRPDETIPIEEDEDATDQVWILPIDGGEARKITSAREGVLDYEWVPDSGSIVYLASEPRPRPLEHLRKDERNRRKNDPIVERDDRLRRQLWRVDVEEEKPKLLLTGDYGLSDFAVSPDGDKLAFVTNYSGDSDDYHLADLYVRYLSVGKTLKLLARAGGKYHLRWSPDSSQLAFLSWLDPQLSYSRECVFLADVPIECPEHASQTYGKDAPGLTECRLLTELDYDLSGFEWAQPVENDEADEDNTNEGETEEAVVNSSISDLTNNEPRKKHEVKHAEGHNEAEVKAGSDADAASNDAPVVLGFALAAIRTGSEIIPLNTEHWVSTGGQIPNTGYPTPDAERYDLCVDPGGRGLAYVQESDTAFPEIYFRDESGQTRPLTKINADLAVNYLLPRQEVVSWQSPDGLIIEGVLTYPAEDRQGDKETRRQGEGEKIEVYTPSTGRPLVEKYPTPFPLIVQIHGGPKGRASNTLQNYSMAAVWAAEGYGVLRPNFRGSEGYGNAFAVANRRDLGGGDFDDIMAGVDWCVSQGIADPEKLGVMGGSYGGYMTNWAIGHTDRFKAAISMFGIFHLQTDYSNSELSRWENEYAGAYYWEDPDIYRKMSPGTYLDAIKTPTLIIHGDEDSNTFISNSKELYQALRHRGVITQFVHYPREGHGLREPNHKLDEMRRCLAWMDTHVRHGGQPLPAYRISDRVPNPNGLLELCVTRAEIAAFVGQPKPEKDAPNPTLLLEVVFTLHNRDTREHVPPLSLPLVNIRLELPSAGSLTPVGIPLDVLGGKVLVEGEHLRIVQHPDVETGQLAFGCAVVFRIRKETNGGKLHIADFPPVRVRWIVEEEEAKESEKSEE